jgi:hypothetical protein
VLGLVGIFLLELVPSDADGDFGGFAVRVRSAFAVAGFLRVDETGVRGDWLPAAFDAPDLSCLAAWFGLSSFTHC